MRSTSGLLMRVRVARGARQCTRTPVSASSRPSASLKPRIANFVAEYTA